VKAHDPKKAADGNEFYPDQKVVNFGNRLK